MKTLIHLNNIKLIETSFDVKSYKDQQIVINPVTLPLKSTSENKTVLITCNIFKKILTELEIYLNYRNIPAESIQNQLS